MVHLSNRHLRLEPVVAGTADALGVVARVRNDDDEESDIGKSSSTWAVLAKTPEDLGRLKDNKDWEPLEPKPGVPLWTDDYSSIVSVMNWDWLPAWMRRAKDGSQKLSQVVGCGRVPRVPTIKRGELVGLRGTRPHPTTCFATFRIASKEVKRRAAGRTFRRPCSVREDCDCWRESRCYALSDAPHRRHPCRPSCREPAVYPRQWCSQPV